jgi:hypothetical protein
LVVYYFVGSGWQQEAGGFTILNGIKLSTCSTQASAGNLAILEDWD